MTPHRIIVLSIKENFSIVRMTAHNEIGHKPAAPNYVVSINILVNPRVELPTRQCHFLLYVETYKNYGRLLVY